MKRLGFSTTLLAIVAVLAALAIGCASTPPAAHPQQEPLVHRFEDAEHWAKIFDDPARDAWQKPDDVVAALKLTPGMTVADVGAGTGYFESRLSRAVGPSGAVLAVDIEPDMVRYLDERAKKEHLDNVKAVLSTPSDPKLPAGKVDCVLIVDTWHHIPDRPAFAAKLAESLAPNGTIAVVDFTMDAKQGPPKVHRIAPEQVIQELAAANLAAEVMSGAGVQLPDQYIVVARRR